MYDTAVEQELSLSLQDIKVAELRENCFKISFITSRGTNHAILHHKDGDTAGTVLVGGTGGGFDGPAGIYVDLGKELLESDISSLRLDYRRKAELEECVLDTLMGIQFLNNLEISRIGLVGWSFGGAVVIDAGAVSDSVKAVVTVASQTYGTELARDLSPKALLLIHGTADQTLPPSCSQDIFNRAKEPKELVFFEGGNHGVDQKRNEMRAKIEDFLTRQLQTDTKQP